MDEVKKALKKRHPQVHHLMFQRSIEKSKSNGELFDILESIPDDYPVVWDDKGRCWKMADNLLQKSFFGK